MCATFRICNMPSTKPHWSKADKAPVQSLAIYKAYIEVEGHKKSDRETAGEKLLEAFERHVKLLGQDDMVSDTRFDDPHIRCQPPGEGVQGGWSALIGVSLTAILFGIVTLFFTVLPPISAEKTLKAMAFKGEGATEALL